MGYFPSKPGHFQGGVFQRQKPPPFRSEPAGAKRSIQLL